VTIGQLVQRVARTGPAQRIVGRPPVVTFIATLIQASTVRSSLRFVLRELSGDRRLGRYRLRRSPQSVFIRHGTADPSVLEEVFYSHHYEVPEHVALLLNGIERPPRLLDLGANIGLFGVWALHRFPESEITGFEPDPANAAVARLCIEANAAGDRWRLIEAAATAENGKMPFVAGEFSRSRIEAGGRSEVEAVDVFPYLGSADLAKIDIEGGEWAILSDPRLRELGLTALVLEYHPDQAPGVDPRALALDALRAAGYEARVVEEFGAGHGMLWAWRPDAVA
jgi:FkbM family methyltransferase